MSEITKIISAFSADQVVKLTGLTVRQLSSGNWLDIFSPNMQPTIVGPRIPASTRSRTWLVCER